MKYNPKPIDPPSIEEVKQVNPKDKIKLLLEQNEQSKHKAIYQKQSKV